MPASLPPPLPPMPAITRYVAPESGDDSADGLTPETAWRHPPGDANATGLAAAYAVQPGDHIAFRGGERFTGKLRPVSGALGNRVIYSGNAWGNGRCIYDGSDAVSLRPPASKADAGGWDLWDHPDARIAEWAPDDYETDSWLNDDSGLLHRAQYPRPSDPVLIDDFTASTGEMVQVADHDLAASFRFESAELAAELAGEANAEVFVRRSPNQFQRKTVVGIVGDEIELSNEAWGGAPYATTDVYLWNCVKHVQQPGDFALIAPGKAILLLRGNMDVRRAAIQPAVAQWRGVRFTSKGGSYCDIRGFHFRGFAGPRGNSGNRNAPISSASRQETDNRIFDNLFTAHAETSCILASLATNMEIFQNRFAECALTGAVADGIVGGLIQHNVITRMGATAIATNGDRAGADISYNAISFCNGVHGNGGSTYGDQTDVHVHHNAVLYCERPWTHQGHPDGYSGRVFEDNIFLPDIRPSRRAAAGLYGFRTNGTGNIIGYELRRNMAFGDPVGIAVYRDAAELVLEDNWSVAGISRSTSGVDRSGDWVDAGNVDIPASYLDDVGAILMPDLVIVPRPDGSTYKLDLRGVAADMPPAPEIDPVAWDVPIERTLHVRA